MISNKSFGEPKNGMTKTRLVLEMNIKMLLFWIREEFIMAFKSPQPLVLDYGYDNFSHKA